MVLVNAFAIQKWVREKVVNGVDISISFLGLMFILVGVGAVVMQGQLTCAQDTHTVWLCIAAK